MGIELGAYLQGQLKDEIEERKFKVIVECNSCGSNNCKITAEDHDVFIDCLDCREGAMDYEW